MEELQHADPITGVETPNEKSVRLARLCADVIHEITETARDPGEPELRADLLLQVEDLAAEIAVLLRQTRQWAWPD